MRIGTVLALGAALLALSGCARWVLPSNTEARAAPEGIDSYETAQNTFGRIAPFETSAAELAEMKIHPGVTPNLRVANYLEIVQRFMPQPTIRLQDLDPAVQACINAKDDCEAWIVSLGNTESARVGDVSLDLLGFEKQTQSTSWNAEMVLLLTDDVVIYKLWGGAPLIQETKTERKPLGPFQDLSGTAATAVKNAVQ
ncbi:MAG: hypothetical protein HXY22_10825 [Alphaproteobacteria bacterium]|nr:hypothetical protein [Alphaproteobacteria bacterium]